MAEQLTFIALQAFRGVAERFEIRLPKGRSLVVFGPNGTGKSTIADALEWYFTGWIDALRREGCDSGRRHVGASPDLEAGVQNGRKAERLKFATLSPFPGERSQAEGIPEEGEDGAPQRVAVSIGPQYGTVDPEWIRKAAREATRGQGFDLLLVCAFAFDAQASKTKDEFKLGKLAIQLVRMNSDLAMGDVLLKKTGSGNLFMVFGEPDVQIDLMPDGVVVEIRGVDVYNPTTGEIRSSGPDDIALWMLDTDYDGESFFVRHCYFTGNNDPYARLKKALKTEIDEAAWATLYSTRSRPFPQPQSGKVAVKVINHYGDEVLQIYDVTP